MKLVLSIKASSKWLPVINQAFQTGFAIVNGKSLEEAHEIIKQKSFDIILVDAHLPGALDIPNQMRKSHLRTLFVLLSEKANTTELVDAFGSDYDDYLALPLEPVEVRLRLAARLKDRPTTPSHEHIWKGALRLNIPQQRVVSTEENSERDLELTPNEFRILYALLTRERQTLSREQILKEAWGENLHVEARTVDKHVCSLRRKLGSHAKALVSVAGKGYLFDLRLIPVAAGLPPSRNSGGVVTTW